MLALGFLRNPSRITIRFLFAKLVIESCDEIMRNYAITSSIFPPEASKKISYPIV